MVAFTPPLVSSSLRSAFVRGCPARGVLGGLSRYTHEVVLLCQVAGYDPVIVETVGLGQSEVGAVGCAKLFSVFFCWSLRLSRIVCPFRLSPARLQIWEDG